MNLFLNRNSWWMHLIVELLGWGHSVYREHNTILIVVCVFLKIEKLYKTMTTTTIRDRFDLVRSLQFTNIIYFFNMLNLIFQALVYFFVLPFNFKVKLDDIRWISCVVVGARVVSNWKNMIDVCRVETVAENRILRYDIE